MPAAWYPDPTTPGQLRWWDGNAWTESVSQPTHPVLNAGPNGKRYAGFWERFLALLLDTLVIYLPLGILGFALGDGGWFLYFLIALVVEVAYFIGMIGKYGRTLGMRVMSIRVVVAGGGQPDYQVATKRWLLPGGLSVVSNLNPFLGLLGIIVLVDFLSMLWDDQNQCWHDKIAGTWVVHDTAPPEGAQSYP